MSDEQNGAFRHTQPGARAREVNPRKLRLQAQAYALYMDDYLSYEKIGEMLKISRRVASEYVRAEKARRPEEDPEAVALERVRQVAMLNRVIARNFELLGTPQATGREFQYIIMASERIAKLLGLDAPTRVRDETPPPVAPMIGGVDPQRITALLRMAIAAKDAPPPRTEDDL